jgi:hypothetical protein
VPYYTYQISFWIVLLDSTTWTNSNNILLQSQTYTSLGSYSAQEAACNSATQTYYRIVYS